MNSNSILLGAFVGVLAVAMFTPMITFFGFNSLTSMILLYTLPIVGAASVAVSESIKQSGDQGKHEIIARPQENFAGIMGKGVVVHTHMGGVYKGTVSGYDGSIIMMEKASRLDLPDSTLLDNVFIEKTDVKRIEMPANQAAA